MFSFRFLASLSTACLISASALAQAAATVDENAPVTRKQLPALIKEALVNDPSILNAAIDRMQMAQEEENIKKASESISKNKTDLFSDPTSPTVGAADADVTIVEFFDYHCGYCKQALKSVSQLLEKDKKIRIVFKEYPILSEDSIYASKAALAVNRIAKDKYFDFHKAMFDVKGAINETVVLDTAKKLGIDTARLKTELTNPELTNILDKDRKLGADIGVQGTPAFIIGNNFYPGAVPYETMVKAIEEVRNSNKKSGGAK